MKIQSREIQKDQSVLQEVAETAEAAKSGNWETEKLETSGQRHEPPSPGLWSRDALVAPMPKRRDRGVASPGLGPHRVTFLLSIRVIRVIRG